MAKKSHLRTSDVQGLTRAIRDATLGITDVVESMHRRVVHPPMLPSTPVQQLISGIAGISFQSVRFTTQLVGRGLDRALGLVPPPADGGSSTPERESAIAVLNGVVGDYLVRTANPLAIPMQFRFRGKRLTMAPAEIRNDVPNVGGRLLLKIHGLCMTDTQWCRNDHDHGERLARELGWTPVSLLYNSGQSIAINGRELSHLLEQLAESWPVPVEEIAILAHSMGGLVSRRAVQVADGKRWPSQLRKIVFLGTPHHGAPLERAGNYVDILLGATPYAKPFAKLGKIRSAGITDLRYGDASPLPAAVRCCSIAATTSDRTTKSCAGDGLVPVGSALGRHKDPIKNLAFAQADTWIAYECNHLDLLSRSDVYKTIKAWCKS